MKKIFVVGFAGLMMACGGAKVDQTVLLGKEARTKERQKPRHSSASETANWESFSSSEEVGEIINYLASDKLMGRDAGTEGINKAAQHLENLLKSYGVAPYFTSYKDTLSNFEVPTYNIVGYLEGTDETLKDEFVIVGAHYDHIGIVSPVAGDSIANGANDNASGTTTVMGIARYFGETRANKRSLIFALFSAEEKGLLGSKHLAQKLKQEELNLYLMLNFEMVGVPMKDKDYLMYLTGYEESNLAEVSNAYAKENLVGFLPTAKEYNLFMRSDNYPFHLEFGIPSQTFCTFDFTNYDYYHHVGDEAYLMDLDHMANLVNKTIPVLEQIVNAPMKEITYH
ncbi:M28 family metallopeptidase [Arenibacter amylolyticus]|uniref:M28 family metallopeptidase n=1 Tax=Arenibacter amylolyticus TaxID=1406873 RepID=UPI000A37EB4D|nr:M28 family peptidase [Arenibacter amylolyticus]